MFTLGAVQFAPQRYDVAANIAQVAALLNDVRADLLVLPELANSGYLYASSAELVPYAEPGDGSGPFLAALRDLAASTGGVIVAGFAELADDGLYNSAAAVSAAGVIQVYRKTHLFPTERVGTRRDPADPKGTCGWSTPGRDPVVIETPLANIGLTICFDGDFPELYRAEALMGAEVICRPSALLRSFEIWELTNRARAYDNHVYIVACNAVGLDAGGNYYFGHSMIVDPIAHKLAQARGTEEVCFAELDPDPLKRISYGVASPMIFDHLRDRNTAAYHNILRPGSSRFEPGET